MDTLYVVDTDVMIDYLRGREQAVAFVRANAARILVPAIVAAELYAGVKGDRELEVLDELLSVLRVVPVRREAARLGGLLRRDYGPSHGVGLADVPVAATAQSLGARLMTLNVKHFPMIPGLKPAYLRT